MIEIRVLAKVFVVCDGKLLLIRRSLTDNRRPGEWDIPGGHAEPGEFAEETAVRETLEEANVAIDPKKFVLAATHTQKVSEDLIAHWLFYVGTTDAPNRVAISHEHDAFQWVTPEEGLQLITYDVQHNALQTAIDYGLLSFD